MTFVGSIPSSLRSIVKEAASHWPVEDAYIGCSGNFTIERTLRDIDPAWRLHGNDVSIFTTAIGNWLAGRPVELSLTEDWAEELDWIAPHLDGGVGSVAVLQLLTHFAPDLRVDHPWRIRNVEAHRRDFARLHEETVAKLEENRFGIASFDCMDVRDWLDTKVPDDATVLSFPPFDVGGYEKLYGRLDEILDWPRPTYEVMDQDGVEAVVRKITDRPRWLMGVLARREDLDEYLVGYVKETNGARPFYVYAKGGEQRTRFVVPRMQVEAVTADRLWPGETIGDRMTISPLSTGQFLALRSKYLNTGIAVGTGNINYPHAVLVDGKLIGAVAYGTWTGPNEVLLLTDFAVEPHDYPKLSKLVVMAAASKEFQRIVERGFARRCRRLTTAVYSNRPVSMKYRGLFDLADRDKAPPESPFKHKLTYKSDAGRWTLDEALALWKQKWGHRAPEKEDA
jgi:hypothetical protein